MKLHYYRPAEGNFGDELNVWIWPRLLGPGFLDDDPDELFVGIGTLLNDQIPKARRTLVFGSGHGYGAPPRIDASWDFLCVRGPKTAHALGLPLSLAITDPAILIHGLTTPPAPPPPGRVGYVPHHHSAGLGAWDEVCAQAGLHFIDPRGSVDRVIAEIRDCRLVVTEAMHGAIFADALRVPWVATVAYPHISAFKWEDWCLSMGLVYSPHAVPPIWRDGDEAFATGQRLKLALKRSLLRLGLWRRRWALPRPRRRTPAAERDRCAQRLARIASEAPPCLSADALHAQRIAQLQEKIQSLLAG